MDLVLYTFLISQNQHERIVFDAQVPAHRQRIDINQFSVENDKIGALFYPLDFRPFSCVGPMHVVPERFQPTCEHFNEMTITVDDQ